MGEEVERLEDHAQPPAHGHRLDGRIGDHLAVEEHVTVVDVLEQVDAAQQGRLARPRGADERDRLVLGDQQVDAAQDGLVAVGLGHAADLEHRGHAARRLRCRRST
jgi:hypothetical protein